LNEEHIIPDWETRYNLGIPEIDLQHQYFLKLIKRIYNGIDGNTPDELIHSYLDEVFYYARFHFCSEENLMKLWKSPGYEKMKESHENLMNKITNIVTLFNINKIELEEIITFLVDWFIEHEKKEDKKLTKYYLKYTKSVK